jgi:hypothetical protein
MVAMVKKRKRKDVFELVLNTFKKNLIKKIKKRKKITEMGK